MLPPHVIAFVQVLAVGIIALMGARLARDLRKPPAAEPTPHDPASQASRDNRLP
jgi:hypothetical protein